MAAIAQAQSGARPCWIHIPPCSVSAVGPRTGGLTSASPMGGDHSGCSEALRGVRRVVSMSCGSCQVSHSSIHSLTWSTSVRTHGPSPPSSAVAPSPFKGKQHAEERIRALERRAGRRWASHGASLSPSSHVCREGARAFPCAAPTRCAERMAPAGAHQAGWRAPSPRTPHDSEPARLGRGRPLAGGPGLLWGPEWRADSPSRVSRGRGHRRTVATASLRALGR